MEVIMKIHESAEDYLETILQLKNRIGDVRSIDIVNELGYSKPSVSVAMKKLREFKLITVEPNGYINLTEEGLTIASRVYERHVFISNALMRLGVSENTAKEDACKMEHHLSEESYLAIKAYFKKLK